MRITATTIAEPANSQFLRRSAAFCWLRSSSSRCLRSRLARRVSCLRLELLGTDGLPSGQVTDAQSLRNRPEGRLRPCSRAASRVGAGRHTGGMGDGVVESTWRPAYPVSIELQLAPLQRGTGDPTQQRAADGSWWRSAFTPAGPGSLRLTGSAAGVHAQ